MYQVISWNPSEARKPDIEQVKDICEVLKLVYQGGTHGLEVVVHKFCGDDSYGDELVELFDSSVSLTTPALPEPVALTRKRR